MKLEMNRIKTSKYPPVRVGDEVKYTAKKGFPRKKERATGAVSNTRFQGLKKNLVKINILLKG